MTQPHGDKVRTSDGLEIDEQKPASLHECIVKGCINPRGRVDKNFESCFCEKHRRGEE